MKPSNHRSACWKTKGWGSPALRGMAQVACQPGRPKAARGGSFHSAQFNIDRLSGTAEPAWLKSYADSTGKTKQFLPAELIEVAARPSGSRLATFSRYRRTRKIHGWVRKSYRSLDLTLPPKQQPAKTISSRCSSQRKIERIDRSLAPVKL